MMLYRCRKQCFWPNNGRQLYLCYFILLLLIIILYLEVLELCKWPCARPLLDKTENSKWKSQEKASWYYLLQFYCNYSNQLLLLLWLSFILAKYNHHILMMSIFNFLQLEICNIWKIGNDVLQLSCKPQIPLHSIHSFSQHPSSFLLFPSVISTSYYHRYQLKAIFYLNISTVFSFSCHKHGPS